MGNYSRFYTLLGRMAFDGDRDELKAMLVGQFTGGRTDSLREMARKEYDALCDHLDAATAYSRTLRKKRSQCLHLMQRLGIDTTDWNRINDFCRDARIAGKSFARLAIDELDTLAVKLRAIERRGGLCSAWKASDDNNNDGLRYMLVGRAIDN